MCYVDRFHRIVYIPVQNIRYDSEFKGIVHCYNARDMGSSECNSGPWVFHKPHP